MIPKLIFPEFENKFRILIVFFVNRANLQNCYQQDEKKTMMVLCSSTRQSKNFWKALKTVSLFYFCVQIKHPLN